MAHELCLKVMQGKLFLAPIGPSPSRVIDLATGTGIWAIDFGKEWSTILLLCLPETYLALFCSRQVSFRRGNLAFYCERNNTVAKMSL